MKQRFSRRHGHAETEAEITVRHDAPDELRQAVVSIAYDIINPTALRSIVCDVLRIAPDPNNWSDYPNVNEEVRGHLDNCKWYYVYDVIERIYDTLLSGSIIISGRPIPPRAANEFADEINQYFREHGIGWQLTEGYIKARGPKAFEESVRKAQKVLENTGRNTAAGEIHEAISDLSRRHSGPDITGAIQHAMAGMECVMRDITGDPKATPGEILKKNPDLLPKPLDEVVVKIWGYASERGRHLREGRLPGNAEAELMVVLSCVTCLYLIETNRRN